MVIQMEFEFELLDGMQLESRRENGGDGRQSGQGEKRGWPARLGGSQWMVVLQ